MGRKKNLKQKKILEEKEYTNSEKIVIIAIDTNEINGILLSSTLIN